MCKVNEFEGCYVFTFPAAQFLNYGLNPDSKTNLMILNKEGLLDEFPHIHMRQAQIDHVSAFLEDRFPGISVTIDQKGVLHEVTVDVGEEIYGKNANRYALYCLLSRAGVIEEIPDATPDKVVKTYPDGFPAMDFRSNVKSLIDLMDTIEQSQELLCDVISKFEDSTASVCFGEGLIIGIPNLFPHINLVRGLSLKEQSFLIGHFMILR